MKQKERIFIIMIRKILLLSLLLASIIVTSETHCFGATVGNSIDLDIPAKSAILRQQVIDQNLDQYEEAVKIKSGIDLEFVFDKDLNTTSEVTKAEVKGQWFMAKLGVDIFNRVEPYVKFGQANLQAKWRQNDTHSIDMQSTGGFAWGLGIKGIIFEFEEVGLRLTGDIQYRTTEPDVEEITSNGTTIVDTGAEFKIEEWQAALVLSKKFEVPLKFQSVFIVPYTGITASDSTVSTRVRDPSYPGYDITLFDANNKTLHGFLIGCDIMPSLSSSFTYNVELRLASETALTLGGAMRF
ncbi:MAG: hypothetical protein KKD90_06880 [Candidatus Omnitrophica bacterium]|nr:hypothetical protein [Candidatus Omnitrophota bacterium]MBU4149033.1 hypothetical protein [Candidatus Omnitrophota bacterium]